MRGRVRADMLEAVGSASNPDVASDPNLRSDAPMTLDLYELDPPRTAAAGDPTTLTAEHALLLDEVARRIDAVLRETRRERWPVAELDRLLDYLHLELLRQVADEEWLLFRRLHRDPAGLARLRAEHLELRRQVELLTGAARARHRSPRRLSEMADRLLVTLRTHFDDEAGLVGDGPEAPSMSALGQVPHGWYPLLQGPVIDLDLLPGQHGVNAVLAHIMRLADNGSVEVRATTDLCVLRRHLSTIDPGGYGFTAFQNGPPLWRLQITRRPR